MKEASRKRLHKYDSIYVKCPKYTNPLRQKGASWLQKSEGRRINRCANRYGVSLENDENVLGLVVMVDGFIHLQKTTKFNTLKVTFMVCELHRSIKNKGD